MTSAFVTLAEIAEALGKTTGAVRLRAKRGGWAHTTRPVRGGQQFVFELDALPKQVARRIAATRAVVAVKAAAAKTGKSVPETFVMVVGDEVFEVRRIGE